MTSKVKFVTVRQGRFRFGEGIWPVVMVGLASAQRFARAGGNLPEPFMGCTCTGVNPRIMRHVHERLHGAFLSYSALPLPAVKDVTHGTCSPPERSGLESRLMVRGSKT